VTVRCLNLVKDLSKEKLKNLGNNHMIYVGDIISIKKGECGNMGVAPALHAGQNYGSVPSFSTIKEVSNEKRYENVS